MPIPVTCPLCGVKYQVPERLKGKNIKCKECEELISVGGASAGGALPPRRNSSKGGKASRPSQA